MDFPLEGLDLTPYVVGPQSGRDDVDPEYAARWGSPAVYDLFAVSNHFGSLGGGHYTAYGFNSKSRAWYSFDDSFVREASPEDCVSKSAYVLFYQRRKGDARPADRNPISSESHVAKRGKTSTEEGPSHMSIDRTDA